MLIRVLTVAAVLVSFALPAAAQEFAVPLSARATQALLSTPEAEPFSYPSPGHRLLVGPEEGQPWDVNLTIGGDWNTNVPLYGDRFTVRREIDGRRSASADTGLTGYHLWRSLPPHTLITGCGFSATSYMSQPQFDQRNYNCMARYDHVVTSDFVASAGLFDQVTELDGQLFRNRPEFKAGAAYRLAKPAVIEFDYSASQSDYYFPVPNTRTQDRDSTTHTIGATGHVMVPGTKLRGQLGYAYVDNRADGSDFDFNGHRITAMATHPLPWDVVGEITYRAGLDDYDHTNSIGTPSGGVRVRDDLTQHLTVHFRRKFATPETLRSLVPGFVRNLVPKSFFGYLKYDYTDRDSNIPFYTYHQNLVRFGITTSQK